MEGQPESLPVLADFEQHTKGFGSKMLLRLGWQGKGLGAKEQGVVEPLVPLNPPSRRVQHGDSFYAHQNESKLSEHFPPQTHTSENLEKAGKKPLTLSAEVDLEAFHDRLRFEAEVSLEIKAKKEPFRLFFHLFHESIVSAVLSSDSHPLKILPLTDISILPQSDAIPMKTKGRGSWTGVYQDQFAALVTTLSTVKEVIQELSTNHPSFEKILRSIKQFSDRDIMQLDGLNLFLFDSLFAAAVSEDLCWVLHPDSSELLAKDFDYIVQDLEFQLFTLKKYLQYETMELYSFFKERFALDRLGSLLDSFWSPASDADCIGLLLDFSNLINIDSFIERRVIKPLLRRVDSWEVTEMPATLFFIRPWIADRIISEEDCIQILSPKISGFFLGRDWSPEDASVRLYFEQLLLVVPVFVDLFLDSYLKPKLTEYWQLSLEINPANQNLTPFQTLLDWRDLVKEAFIVDLLSSIFFPRFLCTLQVWLQHGKESDDVRAYKEEIGRWYQGWKSLFIEQNLLYPEVLRHFNRALHLMSLTFMT